MNQESAPHPLRTMPHPPITLLAPLSGIIVPITSVPDPTFSEKILGDGIAILPENGRLLSPIGGKVESVPKTNHAVMILSDSGAEILIHVGIDTVELGGAHFRAFVSPGDRVKAGDPLLEFEPDAIRRAGYDLSTPIIVTNAEDFSAIECLNDRATAKEPLLRLYPAGAAQSNG